MARILVTGSTTGLGLAAARALSREGHDVVAHARSRDRVTGSRWLDELAGLVVGDLSTTEGTTAVADQAARLGRFDAVIHNAGVIEGPVLEVNVIAPYLLCAMLERPDRLVFLSSSMHRSGSPALPGLVARSVPSYSDTKLDVTALALALAARWPEVASHAVDPGWVPTRMGGAGAPDDLEQGHQTQVWLATADDVQPRTGGYWHHRRLQTPHPAASDPAFQQRLLNALELRTGVPLPHG